MSLIQFFLKCAPAVTFNTRLRLELKLFLDEHSAKDKILRPCQEDVNYLHHFYATE